MSSTCKHHLDDPFQDEMTKRHSAPTEPPPPFKVMTETVRNALGQQEYASSGWDQDETLIMSRAELDFILLTDRTRQRDKWDSKYLHIHPTVEFKAVSSIRVRKIDRKT